MDKNKRFPKGKKRKPYTKEKDQNAPKRPINGYVRYMTEKREIVTAQNPKLSFADITKILGNQWTSLPQEEKKKYLDDADSERADYFQKLKVYKESKQSKNDDMPGPSSISPTQRKDSVTPPVDPGNIPIFTEAFLDHNKAKDAELRQLRKSNAEYAEQSGMLQHHIENLRTAVSTLDSETQTHIQNNIKLQNKLLSMKKMIVKIFWDLPLPGSDMVLNVKNADTYMKQMQQIMENPSDDNSDFIKGAQEIMLKKRKRDFEMLFL